MEKQPLNSWAMVELFGHSKVIGHCQEVSFGSNSMLQINIPAHGENPEQTRIVNFSAIYSINPCTEETAMLLLQQYKSVPIYYYDIANAVRKKLAATSAEPATTDEGDSDEYDENTY